MANIELKIEDSYDAVASYYVGKGVHILSDLSLVCLVGRVNGSNWDWELYRSTDNGNTWSLDYTILTNVTFQFWHTWVGNSLYFVKATSVANEAMTFYRIDYDPGPQTFSTAVSATEIRAADSNTDYYYTGCDVEPGGRVWVAYRRLTSGSTYIEASYSDNGGSTWTESTGASTSTVNQENIGLHCLEGNTIIIWTYVTGGSHYIKYKYRLHTDGNNSWSADQNAIGISGGDVPRPTSAKGAAVACKNMWAFAVGTAGSGNVLFGASFTEGASPFNLTVATFPTTGSAPTPDGEDVWVRASGRNNGVLLHYVYSGTLSTTRRRKITNGDTAWGSESTYALAAAVASYNKWSCAPKLDYNIADDAFLFTYNSGSASPFRPWFLLQNVTSPIDLISDLLVETLSDLDLTADLLGESLADLNLTADLLAETLTDLAWVADIPVEWFGLWLAIVDSWTVLQKLSEPFMDEWHVVATALDDRSFQDAWDVKVLLGAQFPDSWRVLPQEIVTLFNSDIQLPKATVDKI